MLVTKRSGQIQELDLNKIHAVLSWACEGKNDDALNPIKGVSVSQIEMMAQLHFYDKMPTSEIHEILIKAARDLISEDYPNYDQVAARLVWFAVRKEAFNNNLPPHLGKVIQDNVDRSIYSQDILDLYSSQEINELNSFIDHTRDDLFKYAGAEQMRKKYLVQNRKTKKIFESFQFPYIMVAALLFAKYPKNTRMKYVKRYYDLISQHYISLPTPIMAGLRTKVKQFSSCVLVNAGDSLDSIIDTSGVIVKYASRKAGLGVNIGRIRAVDQAVRGGDAVTTGVIPFAKYLNAALKSCSQGAVRGASATFNYPIWHLEFERLIELKNNKGTDETRLRTVDYCIHINELFYKRLVKKGDITFFSPEEVPDLYEAFYSSDPKKFEKLYKQYEKDPNLTKKVLPAMQVFSKIMQERFETGRIYILNADTVNVHGSFYESIEQTNLCTEITLPTTPIQGEDGLVALCTLSAVNWGKLGLIEDHNEDGRSNRTDNKLKDICEMAVRALDALLDYQEYPVDQAAKHTKLYRPLGIGIIGFAHWLAKHRLLWGAEDTLAETEKLMERMAYYLTDTSIELAKEYGSCEMKTKYHDGIFPIDTSKLACKTIMDWDYLKAKAREFGIRNATLMALMPSETSSQLANETNGIEPPRDIVTIKGSKEGVLPQLVPEYAKLNPYYQTLWEVETRDYLKTLAVIQKYVDQAISVNTSYDPKKFANGEVSMARLLEDLLYAYRLGHKTLYYSNTRDGSGDGEEAVSLGEGFGQIAAEEDDCESGACKI
jgi:ribonucleoside-diphosphate reductase alpha chain